MADKLTGTTAEEIAQALLDHDGESLVQRLKALGIEAQALEPDSTGTIGRTRTGSLHSAHPPEQVASAAIAGAAENLVKLGDVLGAGGMGLVRQGTQVGLRREVAVKQPLPSSTGAPNPSVVNALLREAWIGSNLEHPNIVPIHALARSGEDPLIVMKRVGGTSWSSLLHEDEGLVANGDQPKATLSTSERLRVHFQILQRVCRAVHFAHSKGIVHLDLKPSNVMIGHYGEVYLLDWGLAATFRDDAPEWMPRTTDIQMVVGTPAYLSPEQAEADGDVVGVATDVYLLGAIAHRIATGKAPHANPSLLGSLLSAFDSSPPSYDDGELPEELLTILRKAMAKEPKDRYPSADDLREALAEFIEHRASADLTTEALERLRMIRAQDDVDSLQSGIHIADLVERRRMETECRFGLVEALRIWPGNTPAREGLDALARMVIEDALEAADWRRALVALDWLSEPDEALALRIRELREQGQQEKDELNQLRELRDTEDYTANLTIRAAMAFVVGTGWCFWNLMLGYFHRSYTLRLSHEVLLLNVALTIVTFTLVVGLVRRSLLKTQIDRRVTFSLGMMFVGTGTLWVLAAVVGLNPVKALALASAFYLFYPVLMVFTIDLSFAWSLLILFPLALGQVIDWEHVFEWQAAYGTVVSYLLAVVWLWGARKQRPARVG